MVYSNLKDLYDKEVEDVKRIIKNNIKLPTYNSKIDESDIDNMSARIIMDLLEQNNEHLK